MSEFKIIGDPTPVVGKDELYTVNQLLSAPIPTKTLDGSKPNPFEYPVEWSVHVLENGRWIKKEENNKTGNKVSYKFRQTSLERKGIRILAKKGDQVARLDIKPQKAESPKIDNIEFLDKNGDKPTKPFAYGQTLKARVHCLHMERRTVYATLWEDDAAGAGHNKANEKNKMKTLPGTVKNGIADIDFVLEPDFAKIADAIKAKGDTGEGKTHEYYVTAEILNKKTASKNTNVANPSYKDATAKPSTPKKETPAQKKGSSKKQEKEKSIGDDIIDWWEGLFKIEPIIVPNPKPPTGNNPLKVGEPDKNPKEEEKDKNSTCTCKDYDLVWGGHPNITCDFRKKVVEISIRQNFDPNHLMAVMWVETSTTFSTSLIALKPTGKLRPNGRPKLDYRGLSKSEINDLPEIFVGGIGLIQFTPAAITGLNNNYGFSLTKKKLAVMTQLDQLDYVEKYIALWKKTNGINSKLTLADLYLLVFSPSKMNGSDDNTTLYREGTDYYNANASVDTDGNNGITKKEIADRAYKSLDEGSKKENKESTFECVLTTSPVENINETGFYIYKNGDVKYIKATSEIAYYVQVKDGADDFKKVKTLTKNAFGLVKFPNSGDGFNRYGGVDTGGESTIEDVGAGDHYLLPQTAAALFGVISDVVDKSWEVHFGDMSSENGSDPTSTPSNANTHHAGHGHKGKQSGLNVDFRYLNKNGTSFQGVSSSTEFDDSKNKDFFEIAFKYGFDKNYATGKSYSGVNSNVGGHYDHGHLGTLSIDYKTVEKINVKIIQ